MEPSRFPTVPSSRQTNNWSNQSYRTDQVLSRSGVTHHVASYCDDLHIADLFAESSSFIVRLSDMITRINIDEIQRLIPYVNTLALGHPEAYPQMSPTPTNYLVWHTRT